MTSRGADGTIRLADSRALAYFDSGDRQAPPVLYFHGIPGCRLDAWGGEGCASHAGVRLVGVDRPGFGRSDPHPGRSLLDWPDDVRQLADALDIQHFAVAGFSAGGPYALACGVRLPQRVSSIGLIAGLGSLVGPQALRDLGPATFYRMARRIPQLMSGLFTMWGWAARHQPWLAKLVVLAGTSSADRQILRQPDVARRYLHLVAEATRQGGKGAATDMRVLLSPWNFELADVKPPVTIWLGEEDSIVTPSMIDAYAASAPEWRTIRTTGDGHFGLENRMTEILQTLASTLQIGT